MQGASWLLNVVGCYVIYKYKIIKINTSLCSYICWYLLTRALLFFLFLLKLKVNHIVRRTYHDVVAAYFPF